MKKSGVAREAISQYQKLTDEQRKELQKQLDAFGVAECRKISLEQSKAKMHSLEKSLGQSGIPKRFLGKSFDNYRAETEKQKKALHRARHYAENFQDNYAKGNGLLFTGTPGTGKTHLAAAICQEVVKLNFSALFTGTLNFLQVIKQSYQKGAATSELEALQKFVAPDLLVLDELGVQHNTESERVMLTALMDERYKSMRPTILISNFNVEALKPLLGPRIIDRLREVSRVVPFDWESNRGKE